MSDFNKSLHQQCSIELQTNCKISVKSVNNCKSYSGFSAGTQKLNDDDEIAYFTVRWKTRASFVYRTRNHVSTMKCPL